MNEYNQARREEKATEAKCGATRGHTMKHERQDAHLHNAHIRSQNYLVNEGLIEETRELKERRHTGQEIGS